jgi:hypothetical protein
MKDDPEARSQMSEAETRSLKQDTAKDDVKPEVRTREIEKEDLDRQTQILAEDLR